MVDIATAFIGNYKKIFLWATQSEFYFFRQKGDHCILLFPWLVFVFFLNYFRNGSFVGGCHDSSGYYAVSVTRKQMLYDET